MKDIKAVLNVTEEVRYTKNHKVAGIKAVVLLKNGTHAVLFKPMRYYSRDRSKYMPHQGRRECARRVSRVS